VRIYVEKGLEVSLMSVLGRRKRSLIPLLTAEPAMSIRRYSNPTKKTRVKARQGRKERIVERSPSRMSHQERVER
jgi:hypothetical protein